MLLFSVIGRRSHGVDLTGSLLTAWPFALALLVGWLLARGWRRPLSWWPTAVTVWAVTVLGGSLLRVVSGGGGAPLSFVLVAAGFFALFMGVARLVLTRSFARDRTA